MQIELVVARYTEPLNWLRRVPPTMRVTIYDKSGAPDDPHAIALPNIGREADTYLQHIVARYDSLCDATVFCQGKPFDHAFDFHATLKRLASDNFTGDFEPFGHLIDTDSDDGARLFQPWSKNEDGRGLDMRGFHRALFGNDGPQRYTFRGGAQFCVSRDCILRRSRDFYERALQVAQRVPDAAHCYERAWPLVFGVKNPDLAWLDGRETAFLKPIKSNSEPDSSSL